MDIEQISNAPSRKPLRLWPGVVAVVLQWLAWFVVPAVFPAIAIYGLLFGTCAALVIVLWWLFFSRAPWLDRAGALVMMPVAVVAIGPIVHASIANGPLVILLSIPLLSLALVAWAAAARGFSAGGRLASLAASMFLACGALALIRTSGVTGGVPLPIHCRWAPTPHHQLLPPPPRATTPPPPPPP